MRYVMCFFPFVGLVLGAFSLLVSRVLGELGFGAVLTAACLTALPTLVTGGIHMDGFLDTMDAKSSYKPMQEKLQILKDPHTGAFAVICGITYVALTFGFFSQVTGRTMPLIALGYVYSRVLSGLSVVTLKKAKREGMAASSAQSAPGSVKWILSAEAALCMAFFLFLDLRIGLGCILTGILVFAHYRHMAYKVFGGITGDLAGYFLQICELMLLIVTVFLGQLL